jgi:hypothetical protein
LGLTRTGCNVILQPSTRGSLGGSTISPLGWLHLGKDPAAATIVIAFVDYNNKVTLPFKAGPQFVTPRHEVQIPKMAPTVLTLAFEEGQPVNHQPPMSTTSNTRDSFPLEHVLREKPNTCNESDSKYSKFFISLFIFILLFSSNLTFHY